MAYQGEEWGGMDCLGVQDGHAHTTIFKVDNQQGSTVQHSELCSMLCGAWMGGGLGENGYLYTCG